MYCVALQEAYNGDTLKTHSKAQLATLILAIRNRYRKLLRSSVKSALTASGFFGAEPLRGISTCMRYSQFREDAIRPNDMEHMINRTNVVADICNQMGKKPLMYRQFKEDESRSIFRFVVKVTPQDNREWHGNKHNPAQERVIKELGIRNPVWATLEPHTGTRAPFGVNHIMIPVGNYQIHHSSEVEDLGRRKDAAEFIDTYATGWPDKSHGANEIIVDCVNYYLVNVGDFVGAYAGKKAKAIIDKEHWSTWSNLNTELLKATFSTYRDVGWYLANPVTNYFRWLSTLDRNPNIIGQRDRSRY